MGAGMSLSAAMLCSQGRWRWDPVMGSGQGNAALAKLST